MKDEPKAIAVVSPAELIQQAVAGGADLVKLEKLLELQERWEANEARKAYHKAMAQFKSVAIKIMKDKKANFTTDKGNVKYGYASLFNIVDTVSPELSKFGLCATWRTHQNGQITVTCKISHELGHSEETPLSAQNDKTGSKNDIQALGSTITYLEKYTFLAITGLAARDQDDDGKSATVKIGKKEMMAIRDLLISRDLTESNLLKFLNIVQLEDLPMDKYMTAISAINAAKKVTK